MSWRSLSLKNMVKNARRYLGYLLSSSVAVMVFFMFSVFILNPTVAHGSMTATAKAVLLGCQYIVIVFAVFFIFFFHAALLRLRGREMGLFTVLGMTPVQLARLVFMESILLGGAAIVIGGLFGALFAKLFLLAMGRILELPAAIPFMIPGAAILRTALMFGLVFILEAGWVSFRTARRTARALIVVNRERQKPPKGSLIWVIVGLLCLAGAYYLAVFRSTSLNVNFFPILIMTATGTYLLFSQVLVVVLSWLRRRPLSGSNMLIVSRLTHRLKDNARVLTVVTLLTAIVLSGMGAVFGMKSIVNQNSEYLDPFPLMLLSNEAHHSAVSPEKVRTVLANHNVQVTGEQTFNFVIGRVHSASRNVDYAVDIISASAFDKVRQSLLQTEPQLSDILKPVEPMQPGHAAFVAPYPLTMHNVFTNPQTTIIVGDMPGGPSTSAKSSASSGSGGSDAPGGQSQGAAGSNGSGGTSGSGGTNGSGGANGATGQGIRLPISVDSQSGTRVMNSSQSISGFMLVVSDQDYAKIAAAAPAGWKWSAHGFYVDNWKQTASSVTTLTNMLPPKEQQLLTATITSQIQTQQVLSIMLFAGFFISVLFFLAAGTSLYFRLQVQQEVDRRQFTGLQRIGMQRSEIGKLLTVEFLIFFGAPILAALVHSIFAMVNFSHLVNLKGTAWPVFWAVVGIYALCMAVYFVIARVRYLKTVA